MRYVAPQNRIIDAASGYPVEGWNHDPKRALFLRSFTQLTAIGQWMELCANVAAGYANTPHLSREQALNALAKLVGSLRRDQHDPSLSAKGLLGNFLDLGSGKRLGPLASDVEKHKIIAAFGPEKGKRHLEGTDGERLDHPAEQRPRGRHRARPQIRLGFLRRAARPL